MATMQAPVASFTSLREKIHAETLLRRARYAEFDRIYREANYAGQQAATASRPVAMIVQQRASVMDDNSPVVQEWKVEGGVCGFAWITVRPGTCSFARWLVKRKLGDHDSYHKGVTIWVHDFGQSMTRKQAYAAAFAKVLRDNGIKAYSNSRMD